MHLTIRNQRPVSRRRVFRQHMVEGISTIGVFRNETFSIKFVNSSHRKIQVKFALDGTDILTGGVANLNPHSKMWVVEGYHAMELKAWPESNHGGAAFMFGSTENSVAAHTHGDLTAKGIISAAIFTEGYIHPQVTYHVASIVEKGASRGESIAMADPGPAIGAGEYQEQHIQSTEGLREPVFSQLLQVRYLWWEDLVAKLQESGVRPQHPTGFHGGIDLGSTPRIGQPANSNFSRFV